MNLNPIIEKAIKWFKLSGIFNLNPNDEKTHGSVNSYFIPNEKRYAYAYSEITGYGLTFLTYLYEITNEVGYINLAMKSFRWLKDVALDDRMGGCLCRLDLIEREFLPKRVCSFDNGMILNGLCNLYRVKKKEEILELAVLIGNSLLNNFQNLDGSMNVRYIYQHDSPRIEFSYGKWSSQVGTFLAKNSIGLLNLSDITGDERYEISALDLCKWAESLQRENGRFITNLLENGTHLHPHSYTCEGLLTTGQITGNEDMVASARKGLDWSINAMNNTSGFPRYYNENGFIRHERNDINAQIIRLMIILNQIDGGVGRALIDDCVSHLIGFQMESNDIKIDGSFIYGFDESGNKMINPNSWVTMFSLQALLMYKRNLIQGERFNPFLLV